MKRHTFLTFLTMGINMNKTLIITPIEKEGAKAKTIVLVIGDKDTGKTSLILKKSEELKISCEVLEIINSENRDTIIYVLKDKRSNEIIILNSGSDEYKIINEFEKVLAKYPQVGTIYTAIRPKEVNPRLHNKMMSILGL